MINPVCDKCKKELKEFGGLVFSPPYEKISYRPIGGDHNVTKYHLCERCWELFLNWLGSKP